MNKEEKNKIWDIIKSIKIGMMTTNDDRALRSRPMHIVQDEFDGTLWFYTDRTSDKVSEIFKRSDVNVTFSCPEKQSFLSLSGQAKFSLNKEQIYEYWNPFVSAWFPNGKDDVNVAMIKIDIDQAEYWENDNGSFVSLYKIVKANILKEKPDLGINEKIK